VDSALISALSSAGVAGVFCILFVFGLIFPKSVVTDLKEENAALRQDNEAQRDRADTAIAAAQASKDIMSALQAGILLARQQPHDELPGGPGL
jgi:hypothetical protein